MIQSLGKKIRERRREKLGAFGSEMKLIGLVILGGERCWVNRYQCIYAGLSRSDNHLLDGILGRRGGRNKNDELCAIRVTEMPKPFQPRIRDGTKLESWRNYG